MKANTVVWKLTLAALVGLWATPALAVDSYTCHKAKALKDPAFIAATPNLVSVNSYIASFGCEIGKLTQVCMPSFVDLSTPAETMVAQCCFKAKCGGVFPVTLPVVDTANGAPTFSGQIEAKKNASLICLPCTYQ